MNDEQARYLIDQFNKYASWAPRLYEMALTGTGTFIAYLALSLVILGTYGWEPKSVYAEISIEFARWGSLAIVVVTMYLFGKAIAGIRGEHTRNRQILVALENYRSQFRSLPDTIALKKLVEVKTKEDVDRLLGNVSPRQ